MRKERVGGERGPRASSATLSGVSNSGDGVLGPRPERFPVLRFSVSIPTHHPLWTTTQRSSDPSLGPNINPTQRMERPESRRMEWVSLYCVVTPYPCSSLRCENTLERSQMVLTPSDSVVVRSDVSHRSRGGLHCPPGPVRRPRLSLWWPPVIPMVE